MPHLTPRRILLLTAVLLLAVHPVPPAPPPARLHADPPQHRRYFRRSGRRRAPPPEPDGAPRASGRGRGLTAPWKRSSSRITPTPLVYIRATRAGARPAAARSSTFYEQTAGMLGEVTRRFVDARVARTIRNAQPPADRARRGVARRAPPRPGRWSPAFISWVGSPTRSARSTARVELMMTPEPGASGADPSARDRIRRRATSAR